MEENKKDYHIFEKRRLAACLTFISGFINAFTYITQDGIFAGVQSGNVIMWAHHAAQGNWHKVLDFTIPIVFFMIGQCLTYIIHKWFIKRRGLWYFGASFIMLVIVIVTAIMTPFLPSIFPVTTLALVASIQVESFRSLRGEPYANVMMTGNVKNAALFCFRGLVEKNPHLLRTGKNIFIVIFTFALGVAVSTLLSQRLGEYALIFAIIPLLYVTTSLWFEEKNKKSW